MHSIKVSVYLKAKKGCEKMNMRRIKCSNFEEIQSSQIEDNRVNEQQDSKPLTEKKVEDNKKYNIESNVLSPKIFTNYIKCTKFEENPIIVEQDKQVPVIDKQYNIMQSTTKSEKTEEADARVEALPKQEKESEEQDTVKINQAVGAVNILENKQEGEGVPKAFEFTDIINHISDVIRNDESIDK